MMMIQALIHWMIKAFIHPCVEIAVVEVQVVWPTVEAIAKVEMVVLEGKMQTSKAEDLMGEIQEHWCPTQQNLFLS